MFIEPAVSFKSETSFVQIDYEGSFIEVVMEIHYRNPYNPLIDVALIITKATANIVFDVREDFKLYGYVDGVTLRALHFEAYYVTSGTTH
jgi:hypothetical protein